MNRGLTLIELLVALALLGLMAGISAVAWRSGPEPEAVALVRGLAAVRERAIRTGQDTVWMRGPVAVRFQPDGSASAMRLVLDDVTVIVEPLTGRAHVTR